jgi:hypothetical protein
VVRVPGTANPELNLVRKDERRGRQIPGEDRTVFSRNNNVGKDAEVKNFQMQEELAVIATDSWQHVTKTSFLLQGASLLLICSSRGRKRGFSDEQLWGTAVNTQSSVPEPCGSACLTSVWSPG